MLSLLLLFYLFAAISIWLGLLSLRSGIRFVHYIQSELADDDNEFTPHVTVFMPLRGVDDGLGENVAAITLEIGDEAGEGIELRPVERGKNNDFDQQQQWQNPAFHANSSSSLRASSMMAPGLGFWILDCRGTACANRNAGPSTSCVDSFKRSYAALRRHPCMRWMYYMPEE